MNPSPISVALLLFTLLLCTCGSAPETEEDTAVATDSIGTNFDQILEVAGYDVTNLEIYDDGAFDLPVQKMGPSHVLWLAALRCDTSLLRQTLADGANPNIIMEGNSAVEEAVMCENGLGLVQLLLEHDVTIIGDLTDTEDVENEPLVNIALVSGNLEVVDLLLRNGQTLYERDARYGLGCSAAQAARDSATLQFLIDRGVDVTELCNFNRTVLHNAVLDQRHDFVDYLLRNNIVDPDIRDDDGDTAYDYAVYNEDQEMMDLLEVYLLAE